MGWLSAFGDVADCCVDLCPVVLDEATFVLSARLPPIVEPFVVVNPLANVAVIHSVISFPNFLYCRFGAGD